MARKKLIDARLTAQVQTIAPSAVTMTEAVEGFMRSCRMKGLSEHTVTSYKKEIKAFRRAIPDEMLGAITVKRVEDFVHSQLDDKFAPTTINTRIVTMKTFFRYCVKQQWIAENPAGDISTIKVRHKVGETFTKAQSDKLLAQPDLTRFTGLRDYAILLTFLHTGVRLSELASIDMQDVSLAEGAVNVQRTKNRYARRIPMTKRLREVLTVYMKARGIIEGEDALFVTEHDNRMSLRQIQYQLNVHGGKVNIHCSPHMLRRTFAKNKIQAGVDVFRVQALMGHSDLEMLKRYYAIFSNDLADVIERGSE